jgi:DNA-binding CsgD family transcriptional regulator
MKLSPRQKELITLASKGLTDEETAEQLCLSVQTVRSYWRDLREKMGGLTRIEIILKANEGSAPAAVKLEPIILSGAISEDQARETVISMMSAFEIPLVLAWGDEGTFVFANEARKRLGSVIPVGTTAIDYVNWAYRRADGEPIASAEYPFARIIQGGELRVVDRLYIPDLEGNFVLSETEAVAVVLNGKNIGALGTIRHINEAETLENTLS